MKRIGILLKEWKANYRDYPLYGFKTDLIETLRKYDVNVLAIPIFYENDINVEFNFIKDMLDLCDGIIIPGGEYIHDIDYEIVKYLYKENKPTLGICLGLQIMAQSFNGTYREKIDSNKHNQTDKYVHNIDIKKDSKLYEIVKESKITINSRHDYHVPNTVLDISAYSEDNITEAIEDKNKKFFIGVQWHPESLLDDTYSERLFRAFVESL